MKLTAKHLKAIGRYSKDNLARLALSTSPMIYFIGIDGRFSVHLDEIVAEYEQKQKEDAAEKRALRKGAGKRYGYGYRL